MCGVEVCEKSIFWGIVCDPDFPILDENWKVFSTRDFIVQPFSKIFAPPPPFFGKVLVLTVSKNKIIITLSYIIKEIQTNEKIKKRPNGPKKRDQIVSKI